MREIGGGIDQHLAAIAGPLPSRAAIATTAARLPPALSPPTISREASMPSCLALSGDPFGRGDGVVDGGGEFVLGRQPIVDRDDDQLAFIGELAAHHVMGIEIADHPAAAVKEHQARRKPVGCPRRSSACRRAPGSIPCGEGIASGVDRFQFRRLGIGDEAGLQIELARFGRRQRFVRRAAGFLKRLEHGGGIGIEGDGHGGRP